MFIFISNNYDNSWLFTLKGIHNNKIRAMSWSYIVFFHVNYPVFSFYFYYLH